MIAREPMSGTELVVAFLSGTIWVEEKNYYHAA